MGLFSMGVPVITDLGAGGHRAAMDPGAGAGVFLTNCASVQRRHPSPSGRTARRVLVSGAAQRAGVAGVCVLVHAQCV